jgi:carboxylate-amine ligase
MAWMVELRLRNMSFRIYDRILVAENKWRAVRYGLEGKLIDFGMEQGLPAPDLIRELLERVEPVAAKLHSLHELEHVYTILDRGSCAEQQLRTWKECGQSFEPVVDFLVAETEMLS